MDMITTIITTYNGATRGYLEEAILSVLNQTYQNFNLLIVDDGSTDETKELCQKYLKDDRINYVHRENGGPAAARNIGIKFAASDLITFLDDDDTYEPNMLQEMHTYFTSHTDPNIGMVYCRTKRIKNNETITSPIQTIKKNTYEDLFFGNFITTSALLIHKTVFDEVGYFRENLKYSEDYDMWLRIANKYGVHLLDKYLVNYRVHDNQLSNFPKTMYYFHNQVLTEAIESAPIEIQEQKNAIFYKLHISHANISLGHGEYSAFREQYRLASQYQKLGKKWKVKYLLSYFPFLMKCLAKVKT